MSLFYDEKFSSYRAQRVASHGASLTLVACSGGYTASFECATTIAGMLGDRDLKNLSAADEKPIPHYEIPLENVHLACQKLSEKHSVALVDFALDSRFVLVWKIPAAVVPTQPASLNLDEY